jgi:universal stress protein E
MDPNPGCILVVLEPGVERQSVLDKAVRIAAGSRASLRLFCCSHDPRLAARLMLSPASLSAARAAFLGRHRDWLESIAVPLRDKGHRVETEAVWDAPLHAGILTEVGLARPGLVMKGSGWHETAMRRLFSHADWRLLQSCPVPVLLTRETDWPMQARVAAAVDPGHPGDPAAVLDHAILSLAERFAAWTGASASVVHAYMPMDRAMLAAAAAGMGLSAPSGPAGEEMRRAAGEAVHELLAGHALPPGAVRLVEGAAVDVLPAWCTENGIDVLVAGVVSRSRLAEAIVGSTAERLLERVSCDLLVVRGPLA